MLKVDIRLVIVLACVAHVFSITLFLLGFFPFKTISVTYSTVQDLPREPFPVNDGQNLYSPVVGRIVMILIDSLRADFIFNKKYAQDTPYLQSLLSQRKGVGFVAKAHPPTATMPRIKALTSGTIPSFSDVVLNFGSSELIEDNLIRQVARSGHKIVFYGDNTWLRMFPGYFIRSEGTTSFFVSDFFEVDKNVTRHLPTELRNHDWNFLILHYLGLDHIGHSIGPNSELVSYKLKEMDDAIRYIHVALTEEAKNFDLPSLIVLCSDHGMDNMGGHGGATFQETRVPLIFVSPALEGIERSMEEVLQVDLVATLSVLLGIPIPKNNVGRLLHSLLTGLDWRKRLYLAMVNVDQLEQVAREYLVTRDGSCLRMSEAAKREHNYWLQNGTVAINPTDILAKYQNSAVCFSDFVSSRLIKFDAITMIFAIVSQNLTLCFLVFLMLSALCYSEDVQKIVLSTLKLFFLLIVLFCIIFVFACRFGNCANSFLGQWSFGSIVTVIFLAVFMSLFVSFIMLTAFSTSVFSYFASILMTLDISSFIIFGTLIHTLSFGASSFIEEEHQTWYFLCTTKLFIDIFTQNRKNVATDGSHHYNCGKTLILLSIIVLLFRISRAWNSTGDKWAYMDDVSDWLNRSENEIWLSATVTVALSLMIILRLHRQHWLISILLSFSCLTTNIYHSATGSVLFPSVKFFNTTQSNAAHIAQINYILIFLIPVVSLLVCKNASERLEAVITGWLSLVVLLLRPQNIVLVAFWVLMQELYSEVIKLSNPLEISPVSFVWMSQAAYFQQGNSNSLAKVDFRSGYVGLLDYKPIFVGPLILCATYAGPVFWILSLMCRRLQSLHILCSVSFNPSQNSFQSKMPHCLMVLLLHRVLPWSFYTIIAYTQRYHLFIWTVFSPKLLFEGTLSLVYVLLITVGLYTIRK